MCGIAGYFGQGTREILESMTNSIKHRGPDDVGFFVENNLGLGHRRLSIIDTSTLGHQPMVSLDQNLVIVFNGEIYNFQELKKELIKFGYKFKSQSDTEVVLAAYKIFGVDCFAKFNGMFALAIYNKANKNLILARDKMGKKPLYWAMFGQTFMFGSELKSLVAHPSFKKQINLRSLEQYLAFDYIPTPNTIFENVYKLEPGHYLQLKNSKINKKKFWDISFEQKKECNKEEALELLENCLSEATKKRLVADVPLGIFLSGGLDSSTIAYYAQKNSNQKIKTFSIGFEEKSYDESNYARQVADFLKTDHYEHILSAKEALDVVEKVPDIFDEPVADYSVIPTYLLSKFTRGKVTVALGGDGGDELFFGYPTFFAEQMLPFFNHKLGEVFLKQVRKMIGTSHDRFNFGFKLDRLLAGLSSEDEHIHHDWMGSFSKNSRNKLIKNKEENNIYKEIENYFFSVKDAPRLQQLAKVYMRTYLMDQVLVKVDRASMANSLEVRAPFLDYQFVDLVTSLPYNYHLKGFETKHLLKELMKDKLPKEIIYRKKQGFGVPLSKWFTKELKDFTLETLSNENIKNTGFFDEKEVKNIIDEHMSLQKDNGRKIWNLLVFQMWYNKWI